MFSEEINKEIQKLIDLYEFAEKSIKAVEIYTEEGVNFPSVNELRYAGRHLTLALCNAEDNEKIEEILKAQSHAKRAIYDTYDTGISYYLVLCTDFTAEYKKTSISKINSHYLDDLVKIDEIKSQIATEKRGNKEDFFEKKEAQFTEAKEIYQRWHLSRIELNKCIREDSLRNIKEYTGWLVAAIIGILSIIFK